MIFSCFRDQQKTISLLRLDNHIKLFETIAGCTFSPISVGNTIVEDFNEELILKNATIFFWEFPKWRWKENMFIITP